MESDVIKSSKIADIDSPVPSDVQCISQIKLTEGKSFDEGDLNVVFAWCLYNYLAVLLQKTDNIPTTSFQF